MAADTPISEVIQSLQAQVEELKIIAAEYQNANLAKHVPVTTTSTVSDPSLLKELEELRVQNQKANYRIEFLCRALDEKDKLWKSR